MRRHVSCWAKFATNRVCSTSGSEPAPQKRHAIAAAVITESYDV